MMWEAAKRSCFKAWKLRAKEGPKSLPSSEEGGRRYASAAQRAALIVAPEITLKSWESKVVLPVV